MSTFKKVISIVLCISMLAGTFAILGGLATPDASAAEGESKIDSYDSLAAAYDKFIYFGTEFYEIDITVNADGTYGEASNHTLTDYFVDAGQILEARLYLKSDMYCGNGTFIVAYDNDFFDVRQMTADLPSAATGYSQGAVGTVNTNHPVYKSNGIKHGATSQNCGATNWMKVRSGYTQDELDSWDFTQNGLTYTDNGQNSAYLFTSDEWVYSWYVKVRDDVKEGDTGMSFTKTGFWKCGDYKNDTKSLNHNGRNGTLSILERPADATADDDYNTLVSATKSMYVYWGSYNEVFFEDLDHTFTCGKNPADQAPTGPVEGTSNIDSYDSLAAAYDKFIYFGTEFYEIDITVNADGTYGEASNHILTDYYVDAGQILEARLYLKSDMYCGNGTFIVAYDNDFFDVRQMTADLPSAATGYSQGAVGTVNTNHPVYKSNGIKHGATSQNCGATNWMKVRSGYTQDELDSWDFTQNGLTYTDNGQNSAYLFTSDEWVYSWYVKVRDDVKEGDTGMSFTKTGFWKCGDYKNDTKSLNHNGRNGTLSILERPENATADDDYNTLVSATKSMYVYWGSYNEVFFEDLDHTFTCGKNPAAGTVKTYNVTFLENDGTELSAKEYVSGAKVEIPAEVDGQLGWADTANGKLADLTDYTASKKATFKRVLDTDEFDVVVNLGGGDYGDTVLPDNATVENGNLVIKAGLNEEVDLTKLPVPEKEGYTGEWSTDKITVDSINGAEAKINWTAKKYTVNFYNAKGDATPVDTITVEYKKAATTKLITAPEGYKFAGWADAATDEIASTSQSFQYTYAEDKDFYAVWTAYDSSITVMVRDYDNEGTWKVGAVTYGDASATALSSTVVNNLLAKAAASINATAADVYTDEALTEQAAKAKAALNYMAQDKLVETALGSLPAAYAKTGNLADLTEEELNKVLDYVSNSDKYVAESKNGVYTIYEKSAFVFGGDKKFYLSTTLDFNVTWKVPVFDAAAGEFTDYTETTGTASTLATGDAKYVYKTTLKTDADTTPPAGYTFKGWKNEATDEYVDYNANVGITLDNSFDRDVVLVADFQETEYTIIFDVQNGEGDGKLTHSDTFKVGEAVTLDGATFVNGYGEDSSLPVIDVENSEQPQKFMNMNGYKFTGWKLGKGADAVDVTFPTEEITYEMLEAYATGTTITIYGQWEALEYELRFFYATPDTDLSADAADRKYAEPIVVKYKTGEVINRDLDEETLAKISENAPEGYRFYQWVKLDGSVIDRKMPAYGLDLYGSYLKQRILLYVDYNNNRVDEEGKPLPLEETMAVTPIITNNPILYGDDVERLPDIEAGIEMGVGTEVKRSLITTGDRPGENYEVVGWNIYHVENGANVFDKNNWKPGVNDEGTTNAYTTLIYQPEWKHHTEFFFRVYGTDGKIYMALGKNFKLYYWTNNYISNRKEAAVNEDPENLVILLFLPEFENWDWNRFFDFEMWSNVTLRFDPVYAPKSMFTIDAFIGLMKALGNLIGSLF